MLWAKLCILAPMALCTAAAGVPVGIAREEPLWRERLEASARECCEVARASGAAVEVQEVLSFIRRLDAARPRGGSAT